MLQATSGAITISSPFHQNMLNNTWKTQACNTNGDLAKSSDTQKT